MKVEVTNQDEIFLIAENDADMAWLHRWAYMHMLTNKARYGELEMTGLEIGFSFTEVEKLNKENKQ